MHTPHPLSKFRPAQRLSPSIHGKLILSFPSALAAARGFSLRLPSSFTSGAAFPPPAIPPAAFLRFPLGSPLSSLPPPRLYHAPPPPPSLLLLLLLLLPTPPGRGFPSGQAQNISRYPPRNRLYAAKPMRCQVLTRSSVPHHTHSSLPADTTQRLANKKATCAPFFSAILSLHSSTVLVRQLWSVYRGFSLSRPPASLSGTCSVSASDDLVSAVSAQRVRSLRPPFPPQTN